MLASWVIVDGYSLLHRESPDRRPANLAMARLRLVRRIEDVSNTLADRITVVFDGQSSGASAEERSAHIEVVFSPPHFTADTVIERLVHESARPGTVLVVTSDRAERQTVEACGAATMSCGDFLEHCTTTRKQAGHHAARRSGKTPRATLGEFFP